MLNFLERRSCEVPRLHHGRTSDYVKLHSWISASANKARKRSLGDWVFWDSRIGLHPSPVHQRPGPQDLSSCSLLAHTAQEGVVGEGVVRISRNIDALHPESVQYVQEAADVVSASGLLTTMPSSDSTLLLRKKSTTLGPSSARPASMR